MRATEIQPLDTRAGPRGPASDRLTQVLVWVAFFLLAAITALITDLWVSPAGDGPVAQAAGPTLLTPTASETPAPTALPTLPPATATEPPPTATLVVTTPVPLTPPPCVPPADWTLHTVQPGNTLFSLGRRYGTDVETLMAVNCLNTFTIFVGQKLYVPGPVETPTVPAPTARPSPAATITPRVDAETGRDYESMLVVASPTPIPTATPVPAFPLNIPAQYVNIVLLGSDKRPGGGAWRTDSMIVVSVDAENNLVRLLSIPRDLWVYIPGYGYERVNTADLWGELAKKGGGPDRVKQTIHHNLGIPVHYYVRIDFQGFMQIINAVGGVDVDVECPLPDISLSAGVHHMNGVDALRYARSRKSTNDFDRGRRQRKVLLALWDQALTLDVIPRLPDLWLAMANTFQTDLSLDQVINLAYLGVQLKPQRILSRSIGPSHVQSWVTPQGAAVLLPRHDEIRAMLESFYAPADTSSLDAVGQVRVQVLNGSARQQAEKLAAAALGWEGYKVSSTGPADRQDYAATSIDVYTGNVAAAQRIARALGVPAGAVQDRSGAQQPNPADPMDIVVILGQNYNPCR